jgi:hypothetical protein
MTDQERLRTAAHHSPPPERFESSVRVRRRPRLELVSVEGEPTDDERRALEETLVQMVEAERAAMTSSLWLRAARSQGRRLGMLDYRDRFSREDAWRLSTRFPFGGREYPGRVGRGDTR